MQKGILSAAVLSAGLLLGSFAQSPARAADIPKDSNTAPAQPPASETQAPSPLDRYRTALDSLNLSSEQKGKIDTLFTDAKTQLKAIRDQTNGDREAAGPKVRELFTKLRDDVNGVLTDDQKAQFKEKMQTLFQRRDMMARLHGVLDQLDLSEDQKKQVHDVLEDAQGKARDLRDEARNGSQDARDKLRALMHDTREKLQGILKDDQKTKFQELMRQGRDQQGDAARKPAQ